jgi:toxin HigB-1
MIVSFKHKGLQRLYERNDRSGVNPQHAARLAEILTVLDSASIIEDVAVPSHRLHALGGDRKGFWALTVRANWRLVFRFENGTVSNLDLVDYH